MPPTRIEIAAAGVTVKSPSSVAPFPPVVVSALPPCAPEARTWIPITHDGTLNVCTEPVTSNVAMPCGRSFAQPCCGSQVSVVHASPSSQLVVAWRQPLAGSHVSSVHAF